MDAQHTPGPWHWWTKPDRPKGYDLAKLLSPTREVLSMYGGAGKKALGRTSEDIANAKLIAAAPDLLAAIPEPDKLETLAAWFDIMQEKRPEWVKTDVQTDLRAWAAKARAAIAKATT